MSHTGERGGSDLAESVPVRGEETDSPGAHRLASSAGLIGLEAFIAVDAAWRLTFVSQAAADAVGLDAVDLIGRDLSGLASPVVLEEALPSLRKAMDRRVFVEFVVRHDDVGGTFGCRAYPLEDGGLGLYVHDVGERIRAVRELRENEQRLRFHLENTPLAVVEWDAEFIVTHWAGEAEAMFGWPAAETLGKPIMDLDIILAEDVPLVEATMQKLADGRHSQVVGFNRNVTRDGRVLDCAWYNSVLLDEHGRMSSVMSLVQDLTAHKQALAAVRGSEVRQTLLLELSDALRDLTEAGAMQEVACARLGRHLGAASCGFVDVLDAGEGVKVAHRWSESEDEAVLDEEGLRCALRREHPVDAAGVIVQPLYQQGRTATCMVVWGREGRVWTEQEAALVREAADRTWAFVEATRADQALRESEALKVAAQERSRLARDLHDSVTQALFAATLKAEALTLADDASPKTIEVMEDVARLNRAALAQMRTLLLELRGEPLEDVPLEQLLGYLAEAARGRTSTAVHVRVYGGEAVPATVHVAAYRIAQEALANVARHAHADTVWLTLESGSGRLRLTVEDDGCGFGGVAQGPAHLGLKSMRERAAEIGADLEIESCVDGGSVVRLEWPGADPAGAA